VKYEAVIGLEVHAQLATRTKIFCRCAIRFGAEPNAATCPVCLGMPGVLPVLNREAVAMAVRAALATHCTVHPKSRFARKNYFYPDLPKGYQISQYELPLATGGWLEIPLDGGVKRVGLTRIHLEEDAGKSVHGEAAGGSAVDFNRSGVPLIEIVGEPDLRSPDEASAYLKELRSILRYLGVCSGDMEKGEFRCDANVSLRPAGSSELGVKAEVKNMNSFRHVHNALEYEIRRQTEVLEAGGRVVQETRLWNPHKGMTAAMRSKEEAHDYRYFPEPDLPPLVVEPGWVEEIQASLPELPAEKRARYVRDLGLSPYDAGVLTESRPVAEFFEAVVAGGVGAKLAANWVMTEVLRVMNRDALEEPPIPAPGMVDLLKAVEAGEVSGTAAKQVFDEVVATGESPDSIIRARGLTQISDERALAAVIDRVLAENPDESARYRGGKTQLLGFFVGKVMKAMGGRANPQVVNQLLKEKLGGG
jgi:aspartyl-tRNA(Asn)/glutamyl-tRNA(Gln) amidotransferase subunit B